MRVFLPYEGVWVAGEADKKLGRVGVARVRETMGVSVTEPLPMSHVPQSYLRNQAHFKLS